MIASMRAAACLWVLSASAALAQVGPGPVMQSAPYLNIPLGYQQMTSLASAAPLPSVPSTAIYAVVVCETQDVRWRDDGVAPTTTVGMLLPVKTAVVFGEKPLSSVQVIQTSASSTCNVSYYK